MHGLKKCFNSVLYPILKIRILSLFYKIGPFFCTISNIVFYITVISDAFFFYFKVKTMSIVNGEIEYVILHAFKNAKLQHSLELSPGDCSSVPLTTNY